jgi:hypothetical protein
LKYYTVDDIEAIIPDCPLTFQQILPISYVNPKLLAPNQEPPTVTIQITLSRPLIPVSILKAGIFATISVDDLYPLPEDWSLREGNEKDLTSSIKYLMRYLSIYSKF